MRHLLLAVGCVIAMTLTHAMAESAQMPLSVGASVFLGHYEQDANTLNGDEPIEWIVLQTDGEQAMLLSRYAMDCQPYHLAKENVTWATTTLRKWLNGEF